MIGLSITIRNPRNRAPIRLDGNTALKVLEANLKITTRGESMETIDVDRLGIFVGIATLIVSERLQVIA